MRQCCPCRFPFSGIEWGVPQGTPINWRSSKPMETIQTTPSRHDDRRKAITELIEAVSKEQEALARILEAEHRKIEKVTELCDTDVDDWPL